MRRARVRTSSAGGNSANGAAARSAAEVNGGVKGPMVSDMNDAAPAADAALEKSRRPKDTPFRQQRVEMWVPVLTPKVTALAFLAVAVAFIPSGAYLYLQSRSVVEYTKQYDGSGTPSSRADCAVTSFTDKSTCEVTFPIEDDMDPPTYVYYQIGNMLQNHRKYVKSRSSKQLTGDALDPDDDCSPLETAPGSGQDLNPCGLIANSLFTDVLAVSAAPAPFDGTDSASFMAETGIAWQVDRDDRFAQPKDFRRAKCAGGSCETCLGAGAYTTDNPCKLAQFNGEQWAYWYPEDNNIQYLYETYPDNISPIEGVENEHFMVWMRSEGKSKFRKLYGIINTPLKAGDSVTFTVKASYYVTGFDGTKAIVISTVSELGAYNNFVGPAFLAMGILSLLIAIGIGVRHMIDGRQMGDARFLRDMAQ